MNKAVFIESSVLFRFSDSGKTRLHPDPTTRFYKNGILFKNRT